MPKISHISLLKGVYSNLTGSRLNLLSRPKFSAYGLTCLRKKRLTGGKSKEDIKETLEGEGISLEVRSSRW